MHAWTQLQRNTTARILICPLCYLFFFPLAEARADASRCQSFWEEDERSGFMGSFKGGAGGEGGLSQTACC